MITVNHKEHCCGCAACAQVCPKNCIRMTEDEEGFQYPQADETQCVQCGLCEKVCPVLQEEPSNAVCQPPKAIGGWHKNDAVRQDSSSGGAFTLFAESVLESGGIVYGCALNDALRAVHIGVERTADLGRLRKSKYVQSDIGNTYKEIREWLDRGRTVLFCGSPCQAAGLKSFLGRDYENLFTVDFICHGVPSPMVFRDYIQHLETKFHEKLVRFSFRCKDMGWSPTGLQLGTAIETETGKNYRFAPAFRDAFMNGFLDDIYSRPSCYQCAFKRLPKTYSDITVADFWDVNKLEPELFDGKGTSLVLLNSKQGEALFRKAEKNFFYKEVDLQKALRRNQSLFRSAPWNARRSKFFQDYAKKPFAAVKRKYMSAFGWAFHKSITIGGKILESTLKKFFLNVLKLPPERWESFFQAIKFALVGVSNVLVSYSVNVAMLWLLHSMAFSLDYVAANLTAFILSVLWSFYWNNRFVFQLKQGESRPFWKTLVKTYLSYAFTGILLNNLLSTLWIQALGISKYIAPLLNLPLSIPINFLMNKFWTYRAKDNSYNGPRDSDHTYEKDRERDI